MGMKELNGKVIIDDFEFYGHIEQDKFCPQCKFNLVYYDDFDTYFCPKCNSWTEAKCSDTHCNYCPNRAEQPLPSK